MLRYMPTCLMIMALTMTPAFIAEPVAAGTSTVQLVQIAQNDVDGAYIDTDDDNRMEGAVLDMDGDNEMEYQELEPQEQPGRTGRPQYDEAADNMNNDTVAPRQNTLRTVPIQQDVTPSVYDTSPATADAYDDGDGSDADETDIEVNIYRHDDEIETDIDEFEDDDIDEIDDEDVETLNIDLDDPVTVID